jgi:hypothetical protein
MTKTIYLVNPTSDAPTYFSGEVYDAGVYPPPPAWPT